MRIAVLNWSQRRAGGAEVYLATLIPALLARGHEIVLASEADDPGDRDQIAPAAVPVWCVGALGLDRVLAELRRWRPDVLYAHGFLNPVVEAALVEVGPAALFAHGFYGTCISGAKSFKTPIIRACERRFGWPCLLHYYPHRCGGLSPITMAREYQRQARRSKLLHRYAAIVTHSRRLESEYLNHGITRDRLHRVPWCVEESAEPVLRAVPSRPSYRGDRPHLVFVGRMVAQKGGDLLLRALPLIQSALGRDVHVTYAGDGPQRQLWQGLAIRLQARHPGLEIAFTGWLRPVDRDALFDESDLLVLPSLWAESFGQIGIEAGRRGVPTAAFAVGGIPDWLENGLNGFLAPADPPSPRELAVAVVNCLHDPETLARLRQGALQTARRWSVQAHLARLGPILASVARRSPVAEAGPAA